MDFSNEQRAALDAALSRIQLDIEDDKKELLLGHLDLLVRKNEILNLTRVTSFDDAIVRHIEDSLSVVEEFGLDGGSYLDIGTGGGFPGIPLGIVTGRPGILMDSVKKKAAAVQEFIDELGLSEQLAAVGARSEEYAVEHSEEFDTVVARAVSSLSAVEELATPLLAPGGCLVAMRGTESTDDLKMTYKASESLGLELISERSFELGPEKFARSVYVFRKVKEPSIKLPRRVGMAQKKPLGK